MPTEFGTPGYGFPNVGREFRENVQRVERAYFSDITHAAVFGEIRLEFEAIVNERAKLVDRYREVRFMDRRPKRPLLSFTRDTLSYLFGVTFEFDVKIGRQ